MVFNKYVSLISIVFILFSCKRVDDAWNEIRVENATNSTIVLNFKRVGGTPEGFGREIPPNENLVCAKALCISDYEIIRDSWGKNGDTMEVYRNDTLLVKWGAPLLILHDSIHSFYNENSWAITNGGRKNKFVIATFTISEDDFKHDN